jgi:hypothetical protein
MHEGASMPGDDDMDADEDADGLNGLQSPAAPSVTSRNSSTTITPSIGASSSSASTIVAHNASVHSSGHKQHVLADGALGGGAVAAASSGQPSPCWDG